ncbi:hypothetical protein TcG_04993 [Trypanosoma cruzi]|uniref:Potassium channel tetramerisation-type BTB domain-containing protein n=1 Tax=Trypanosoma cruzi TaxID=5693 RepID=A0A2V2VW56_TRYCR|nr:hypothetical protein BCY84_15738 [Trypanosoma cruzi cruzi]PWV00620.1 hypothetical protein C4B63_6g492 [Trypanosoma cruzi]RNF18316.1 hypothetical protein TcG_04993 [Trypanosoma cruzi]
MEGEAPLKRLRKGRDDGRLAREREPGGTHGAGSGEQSSSAPSSRGDMRVCINVGGSCITTLASTLCSEPSLLSEWVSNDFAGLPRDANGNPFVDRDPENFRHIVNYLRGYELPLATEKIVFLAEDAEFYRIEKLRALIDPPARWHFVSGPGVSKDSTLFSTENILGICGNEPLPTRGKSILVLRVDKCELVSIGLIGTEKPFENEPLQGQPHSVAYCNTGELVQCFETEKTYVSGTGFKSHDIITVHVSFSPGLTAKITFLCGTVKTYETEWPAPTPPLRFAVSLHGTSAVTLERCVTGDMSDEEGREEIGGVSEIV